MAKNKCGKTRPVKDPYEIWKSFDQSWEWRVLKKYQNPENEAKTTLLGGSVQLKAHIPMMGMIWVMYMYMR